MCVFSSYIFRKRRIILKELHLRNCIWGASPIPGYDLGDNILNLKPKPYAAWWVWGLGGGREYILYVGRMWIAVSNEGSDKSCVPKMAEKVPPILHVLVELWHFSIGNQVYPLSLNLCSVCDWLDQQNVVEVLLYDFSDKVIKMSYTSTFFSWGASYWNSITIL